MTWTTGDTLGIKLLNAMGIAYTDVMALTLRCHVAEVATVTIERTVRVEESDEFVREVSAYQLTQIADPISWPDKPLSPSD